VNTATPFQYPPLTVASLAPPLAPDVVPVVPALAEAPRGDCHCTHACVKFVRSRFECFEVALVLEENDLAVSLAAGLKAGAQLRHRRVTHVLVLNVHAAFAVRAAYDEARFADRREHCVCIARTKESCANRPHS